MKFDQRSSAAGRLREPRDTCRITRNAERPAAGLLRLDQEILVSGKERGLDATGRFWMLAAVEVREGAIDYIRDDGRYRSPGPVFGISVPPFSVLEVALNATKSCSTAFVSPVRLSQSLPSRPVAFDIASSKRPDSIPELIQSFTRRSTTLFIGRCQRPRPLALRIKAVIDDSYSLPVPLSAIATEAGTSASAMSRAFKKSYGIPPVRYRHLIRIMDSMMRLLDGEPVTSICQDVGFDDLGRFYRHFKRYTLSPPSAYRY